MKKLISLVLSLTLVLSLSACGSGQESAENGYTVDTVTATYVDAPLNVPSILERERGSLSAVYGEMGLDFAYSDLTSGADQTAALASGDIQILNAVGTTSVLLAAANGADIAIISMYSRAPEAFMLFSNDDSIDAPEDLRGLTVAGPKGTILHELLAAYLGTVGMTTEDVRFVSMDIPSSLAAMEAGSVDCALLGGAAAYQCLHSGKHLVTDGKGLTEATIVTATSRAFYEANPDIIEAFVENQRDILTYMEENEEDALRIAAEAIDADLADVREMYAAYDFSMEITDSDLVSVKATEAFLYDSGMIENHVDVQDLILPISLG